MASVHILCPTLVFNCPSHNRVRRNMGFQKKVHSAKTSPMAVTTPAPIVRRSANYPASQWSHHFLQSLNSKFTGEKYESISHNLIEEVRMMISEGIAQENPQRTLELVDDLQRLGISYHFKNEISSVLKMIYQNYFKTHDKVNTLDLNLKALGFRLLRQHGYQISQEIFKDIRDETGNFKEHVCEDTVGMLNLYEASFLAFEDEDILDEAREFTSKSLKEMLEKNKIVDQSMQELVSHSLELPLLWRTQRFDAIWFIEVYKKSSAMKPMLLELAKLDFNMVQATHQEDLKHTSRWWEGLGWDKKLSFGRDRLVESFMWAAGASYEPQFGVLRRSITKLISLINVIDDVYDVYGTLDELKQFTDVTKRWDINGIDDLPYYMKICFLGFYNTINEMQYTILANRGLLIIPYLKQAWADYLDANLVEAQWYNNGYTPTLEEFLNNSYISVSLPVILAHVHFLTSNEITGEAFNNIVRYSSMILRLADDLGTSSVELERGDVPKSIQCYMHETGASEDEARRHIRNLIIKIWKKLNKERAGVTSQSSHIFIECATNMGRIAQFTYQCGDGFGSPDDLNKSLGISLLFNPKS